MKTRAITGFFFIAVLIAVVLFGPYTFVASFVLIGTACVHEFYKMVRKTDIRPLVSLGVVSSFMILVLVAATCVEIDAKLTGWYALVPVFVIYIAALFRQTSNPVQDIAYTLFGLVYAAVPFLFFMGLGFINKTYNPYLPLGFLILLWTNDTGAYLAGRSFGKRKLFERISPNKTWEGFVGGVLLAVVVALNLERYFGSLSQMEWISVAIIIGVFGTLGDLVESMLKRNVGVKDSGSILPGHGGLLDRFDGLLMAAPLVYFFLELI
ncbi:phosphatidate cytidylyltransferase [Sphingobacterium suaedae]|uniref:Phosphatidate cytidylyltransferase n=1 Tax=Sphingobacterium suaedae TaxID=1686402 RepID=A0ABW5KDS7_9SPHI